LTIAEICWSEAGCLAAAAMPATIEYVMFSATASAMSMASRPSRRRL